MNELIEKLKDKKYVRAFGLMEETLSGSRECFKKVGKKNCLCFHGGQWGGTNNSNDCFNYQYTYAIKPDYQPEPEFVDVEIEEHMETRRLGESIKWLGIFDRDCPFELPHLFTHLHCLPSLPKFVGFYRFEDDKIILQQQHIARQISEGRTVYARFRT